MDFRMGVVLNIDVIRQKMTVQITYYLFILCILATIIRPMLVKQDVLFTYIGVLNVVFFGLLYLFFSRTKAKFWHPYLLFFVSFSAVIPLVVTSGGVNSQFAVLLPMAPVFVTLIINSRAAWLATFGLVCFVISLYLWGSLLLDFTNEPVDEAKTKARAIWLCLALLFGAAFSTAFDNINQKLSHKLHQQAFKDALTGISNRRSILNSLHLMREEARSMDDWLTVLMIDVDHFKQLNGQHGHLFGDECLQQVAKSIKGTVRSSEDAAGRYGGEEFLVLCSGGNPQHSELIANKIRMNIERIDIHTPQGTKIELAATIGFCCFKGEHLHSENELLRLADEALYLGKKLGRNRVVDGSTPQDVAVTGHAVTA
jgi:diguanylate cyclase (GGDEF)-like protein